MDLLASEFLKEDRFSITEEVILYAVENLGDTIKTFQEVQKNRWEAEKAQKKLNKMRKEDEEIKRTNKLNGKEFTDTLRLERHEQKKVLKQKIEGKVEYEDPTLANLSMDPIVRMALKYIQKGDKIRRDLLSSGIIKATEILKKPYEYAEEKMELSDKQAEACKTGKKILDWASQQIINKITIS